MNEILCEVNWCGDDAAFTDKYNNNVCKKHKEDHIEQCCACSVDDYKELKQANRTT